MKALSARMRAALPAIVEETIALVHRDHRDLVALVGPEDVRLGITHTHERFVRILEGEEPDDGSTNVAFGEATAAVGVHVEALMAGYRIGGQVGWRHIVRHAAELGLPSGDALRLASLSMAYMDELSTNSLEGYARDAAATQGARARARQALLDALLSGGDSDDDLEPLAAAAGWPLPQHVRVAVLLSAEAHRLDAGPLLLGRAGGSAVAVARDPDDEDALAHTPSAAGPPVPRADAARSLACARRLAALAHAGVLPADGAHRWEDHLADLVVHADGDAAAALVAARLAPLHDASPARAALLRETLEAWLDHPGRPREIAKALHLHHQTVRYRLTRLRERLGDDLDDPRARFELQLAVRLGPSPATTPPS
jgi:hypothetical protein